MRVIARVERPHPGAQLRITDADGNRVTAFATNARPGGPGVQVADLELRHRRRTRCEDRIRAAKDTGLQNLPLHGFDQNRVWCHIVQLACELIAWTQLLGYATAPARRGGTQTTTAATVLDRRAPGPPCPTPRAASRRRTPLERAVARRPRRDHRPAPRNPADLDLITAPDPGTPTAPWGPGGSAESGLTVVPLAHNHRQQRPPRRAAITTTKIMKIPG